MCTKLKPFLRVICIIVLASQSLSDIAWVVGVRTGLHFCRPLLIAARGDLPLPSLLATPMVGRDTPSHPFCGASVLASSSLDLFALPLSNISSI